MELAQRKHGESASGLQSNLPVSTWDSAAVLLASGHREELVLLCAGAGVQDSIRPNHGQAEQSAAQ